MTVVTTNTEVTALDLGCGHRIYLADSFIKQRKRDHKEFYCSICGETRYWPQRSDEEKLRSELASTRDMLETALDDRDRKEMQRRAEKGAKTKIKKRIQNGVCPCCNRSFKDLGKHMATKHPKYADSD